MGRSTSRSTAAVAPCCTGRPAARATTAGWTDVYATIYFCPNCSPLTLLETPSAQWGRQVKCPTCAGRFTAPRDDVLHERDSQTAEGVEMAFSCPSCSRTLRCDSIRRGVPISGMPVVCLYCRHLITIPSHGERVARRSRH